MGRLGIIALLSMSASLAAEAKVNFKANEEVCGCRDCSCQATHRRHAVGLIYIDGVAEISLAYDDLPEFTRIMWDGHRHEGRVVTKRRFRVVDVLAALGVPLHDIEYIGLKGSGEHDAVVDLQRLSRNPSALSYEYSQAIAGKTNIHWHGKQPFYGKVDGLHGMTVRTKSKNRDLRLRRQARYHQRAKAKALAWTLAPKAERFAQSDLRRRNARQASLQNNSAPTATWESRGTVQGGTQ